MRLVGVLMGFAESDPIAKSMVAAFRVRSRSWAGRKATTCAWNSLGRLWCRPDRMLAKELVDLRPDAILGQTTPVISALARETRTFRSFS